MSTRLWGLQDDDAFKQSSPAAAATGKQTVPLQSMSPKATTLNVLRSADKAYHPPATIYSAQSVLFLEHIICWLTQDGVRLSVNINARICIGVCDFRIIRRRLDDGIFMVYVGLNSVPFSAQILDQVLN